MRGHWLDLPASRAGNGELTDALADYRLTCSFKRQLREVSPYLVFSKRVRRVAISFLTPVTDIDL